MMMMPPPIPYNLKVIEETYHIASQNKRITLPIKKNSIRFFSICLERANPKITNTDPRGAESAQIILKGKLVYKDEEEINSGPNSL